MKSLMFLICTFTIIQVVFSQTGPGGVGTTDGTSNLVLWLDANKVVGTSGTTITNWPDGSGNGYDFSVGNGAVFNNPSVNGYPAFSFNGSSHYFQRAYTAGITPASFTIFSATNVTSSGGYKAVISNRDDPAGSATAGFILYSIPSSNNWQFWTGTPSSWQITTGGTSTAGAWAGQMMDYQNTGNGKKLYINGTIDATNSHGMTDNTIRPCRVGAGQNESSPNFYFNGSIGEIIMFNTVMNSAQKIIINNYLAAKYNYTLGTEDLYNEDDAGNGDYDHDVAGIGRVNGANIHNDAQGTGIVRILNPSGLGNNEFLFWGHDNGVQQADEMTDVPGSVQARFVRVWRVSEVNTSNAAVDVGSIDIRFDLSGLGSVTTSDLRLLIDTDNDGVFIDETPIAGATSLGGDVYQFTGVTAIANNLRFTLGTINASQTPLPIDLLNFNLLNLNDEKIKINWQTAAEINNDYFSIERSINGTEWELLKEIVGAGNSNSLLTYTAWDESPYNGLSYYRLKQTDFDGKFKYSPVKSMYIQSRLQLQVFPNPTRNQVTIVGAENELTEVVIYDLLGRNVTGLTKQSTINGTQLLIDLSNLKAGIYFVKTKTGTSKLNKL